MSALDEAVLLLGTESVTRDELITDETSRTCLGATWPPSLVPVATFTTRLPALMAIINDTIADGVKKGGVRYFLLIIPPKAADINRVHAIFPKNSPISNENPQLLAGGHLYKIF